MGWGPVWCRGGGALASEMGCIGAEVEALACSCCGCGNRRSSVAHGVTACRKASMTGERISLSNVDVDLSLEAGLAWSLGLSMSKKNDMSV